MYNHDKKDKDDSAGTILKRVLSKHLGEALEGQSPIGDMDGDFLEWCLRNIYIRDKLNNSQVNLISFDRRPFLRTIYEDACPDIVIKKAVQVGGSQFAISRALFWAGALGCTVGFYAPTDKLLKTIVQTRVYNTIALSPAIKAMLASPFDGTSAGKRGIRNTSVIQLNRGVVHFLGSQAPTQLISLDCDAVILDEFDLFSQSAIVAASDRLGGSPHQRRIILSTPSIARVGIAAAYDESDQRQFFFTCQYCGHRGPLEFPASIGKKGGQWDYVCSRCGRSIDRYDTGPGRGEWVAAYPSRPCHGYHIHGLLSPTRTAAEIHRRAQEAIKKGGADEEGFYRDILGEVKVANCDGLEPADLAACVSSGNDLTQEGAVYRLLEKTNRETVMGIDIGKLIHVIIIEPPSKEYKYPRLIYADTIGDGKTRFEETNALDELMSRFNVRIAVIDALPETRFASDFAHKWHGRVYKCYFKPSPNELFSKSDSETIEANRAMAYDTLFAYIRRRSLYFPENVKAVVDLYDHLTAILRTYQEVNGAPISVTYNNFGRPDHYASAAVFAILAFEFYKKYRRHGSMWTDIAADFEIEAAGGRELCVKDEWEEKRDQIKEAEKRLAHFQDIIRRGHT